MTVDPFLAAVYWAQVQGATNDGSNSTVTSYYYPCNSTLPDLNFVVGGANTTVPGSYFTVICPSTVHHVSFIPISFIH